MAKIKYNLEWVVGENNPAGTQINGVAVMVAREQAAVVACKRLAERCVGVVVQHKADSRRRAYVGVHGIHAPKPFGVQLREAEQFLALQGGGLLVGDFNHVPCRAWRVGGSEKPAL